MQKKNNIVQSKNRLLQPGYLKPYLEAFTIELEISGYTSFTIEGYVNAISHFGYWLQNTDVDLSEINNDVVTSFAKHCCKCPGGRKNKSLSCKYIRRIQRFVCYLSEQGVIFVNEKKSVHDTPPLILKFCDALHRRGLSIYTIKIYEYTITKLLPTLGNDPSKYDYTLIRKAIFIVAEHYSLNVIKKAVTVLRAYLRFLILEGLCKPGLDAAVPTVPEWKLSSLPRYLPPDQLELVIASCDTNTKHGLRDHAILLLIARLGLRGGDIVNMTVDDINWLEGSLKVRGKSRRETKLPLPQDVGDSLLKYLEIVRPPISIENVFLCLQAPYRPFATSVSISDIVRISLLRAGIKNPPSHGANLLRHSAATAMLRAGATLDMVSTVLRHRSLDMTGYYAKVDINMLSQISQLWPEGEIC